MGMMPRLEGLVVYGTGDFAKIVYVVAREAGFDVVAFTADDGVSDLGEGYPPFVGRRELQDAFPPSRFGMAMGFIGKGLQGLRSERCREMHEAGYRFPNIVQPGANVTGALGRGNIVFAGASVGCRCRVGDWNILWQNCVLSHDNVVGDFNNISPTASFSGYAKVGSHCLIGNGAALNNFIVVGDWALVGAGAYARNDVPEGAVLVPAESYVLEGRKGIEFA